MPDIDFSSPDHRIGNMTNMRFVRAWARVRHHVMANEIPEPSLPWLQGYMTALETEIAGELGLPTTTLVGRLVDLGRELVGLTDGQDEAGLPTV
jgi:hypothetical protein